MECAVLQLAWLNACLPGWRSVLADREVATMAISAAMPAPGISLRRGSAAGDPFSTSKIIMANVPGWRQ
jgi:hypothetical protein